MITSESSVKSAVEDALGRYQAQGNCQYFRMNSGKMLALNADGTKRMVKLHNPGTWDFLVLLYALPAEDGFVGIKPSWFRVLWIEVKNPQNGKLSKEQQLFQAEKELFGASCYVVTDADQVKEILEEVQIGRIKKRHNTESF